MKKWTRVMYQPNRPLKEGCYVTASKEHIALSREAATEGMVLLKNEHNLLPLKAGSRIALFGKGSFDYVKGGGGSGDVTVSYVHNLYDGFQMLHDAVSLYEPLCDFYRANVNEQYDLGSVPGMTTEPALSAELLTGASAYTDTAVIVLSRFSGEGWDRSSIEYNGEYNPWETETSMPKISGEIFPDGDFYLTKEESAMIAQVKQHFSRIAVVLNIGGIIDTSWIKNDDQISSALIAWQGGMEGGLAAADLLVGDVCPSGHLTDTFASSFAAYPSSANFAESRMYVEYQEDVFVGYRYFETIPGAADEVCYPFGYGLSYTTFALRDVAGGLNDAGEIELRATVHNTGTCAGKYVLQAYVNPPKGRMTKPATALVGFAKTRLLEPGESETLTIAFAPYAFAAYDDEGVIQKSAYVLEKGEYRFRLGENVRETADVAYRYAPESDVVLVQLSEKCAPKQLHRRMLADGSCRTLSCAPETPREDWRELEGIPDEGQYPLEIPDQIPGCAWIPPIKPQLIEVANGELTLEEWMSLLSDEDMVRLLGGQPNRGVANTFGFGNLPTYGVPNVMTADGPAGLRIKPECGVTTTAFPCATLLACTWNTGIVREIGAAGAREVHENGVGVWLTPAINIHRTPLCGRNFEYYSEDPLVAGEMAAAMVEGIQSEGVGASLKHFACNNKETNRKDSDSRVSERALREIYLKGFEICVKESNPLCIMTSYNLVNGLWASQNRELLTDILRGEWGFDGFVMTDWGSYDTADSIRSVCAGTNLLTPGSKKHFRMILKAVKRNEISKAALQHSVKQIVKVLVRCI